MGRSNRVSSNHDDGEEHDNVPAPFRNALNRSGGSASQIPRGCLIGVPVVVVALIIVFIVGASWKTVDPGYVGVIFDKTSHNVSAAGVEPGWVFINPLTESLTQYPASVQTLIMVQTGTEGQVAGDDSVKVNTAEGQSLQADVAILYRVKKEEAGELYKQFAGAPISVIESNVVRQLTRSAMNDEASRYGWEDIFASGRITYTQQVSLQLTKEFADDHLELVNFNLRAWHLPQNLQTALDQKIAAQQQAEQQQYQLEQARIKAQQDQVTAEGQANAVKAKADGDAYATEKAAEAQSNANQKIAQSLTTPVLQYLLYTHWDGRLPMFGGTGGNVLFSVNPNDVSGGSTGATTSPSTQPTPTK